MMPDAEDHFARILEFMVPRAALVLLQDARPAEGDEDRMEPCPLGTGILPPSELMAPSRPQAAITTLAAGSGS